MTPQDAFVTEYTKILDEITEEAKSKLKPDVSFEVVVVFAVQTFVAKQSRIYDAIAKARPVAPVTRPPITESITRMPKP